MAESVSRRQRISSRFFDYLELCKPRVVALIMLTALVGMHLATPGFVPWRILIFGNIGIMLSAASAAVINHLVDRRIDIIMARTKNRPVAQGKITPRQAIIFAAVLGMTGLGLLVAFVNLIAAALTFVTLIGYAVIYTMYLKRATPQNIVIGGLAGAAPPLLGWVCVTGQLDAYSLLPVLIIYTWTPPHFWALAIARYEEYAKANIPMLPVTHGIAFTQLSILLYTILMFIASILPYLTGMSGSLYLVISLLLGARFFYFAIKLYQDPDKRVAMQLFRYSIVYLGLLFVALLVDHYVG